MARAALTAAALAACALVVQRKTRAVEAAHPPRGRFVDADGVRLHFTVHGRDESPQTVVLLHGNGATGQEMEISGLAKLLAERYRVIVFDRPGYGHSDRPADRPWGPAQQADVFHSALQRLGVREPIVLGHSWGALVALAMGLRHPDALGSLVLVSGYYFPSLRLDVPFLSSPALPGIGALMRRTVSPLLGRLLWPLMIRRLFAPAAPTAAFTRGYAAWMSLRPSQLRASAAETAALIPAAYALRRHYGELDVPAVLVAGAKDRLLSSRWHSARLHDALPRSWLRVVEGAGHMVHHVAPGQVAAAVDQAAAMVWDRSLLMHRPEGLNDRQRAPAAPTVGAPQ